MRRIERLINLIAALLETPRPLTAQEIRERIAGYDQPSAEAFRRAFERDKEDLRAIGIPLEVVPTDPFVEQPDGYIIPKARYYLPDLDLEPDELTALRVAAETILGGAEEAELGLMKLSVDESVGSWSGPRVVWSADLASQPPLLGPLYTALIERHPVSFNYRPSEGDKQKRTIEPYGLVHVRGTWYLVGRDRDKDALRSFRLGRIEGSVSTLADSFEPPEDFDAAAHIAGEAFEFGEESSTATVRFDARMRWWPEQNMPSATTKEGPRGSLDVELPVGNIDALISWVLGFGEHAQILEPEAARQKLHGHLAPFVGQG
jgi:proteasome accessory factor B